MTSIISIEQQIHDSIDEILRLVEGKSDDVILWKPSADQWSIMEILCHVEEAMVYWVNELQSVIKQPENNWGRGLQHETRLKAIAEAGVEAAHQNVKQAFIAITEDNLNLQATHRNPKFGTKPMSFLVQHFMIEHLNTHANQIRRVLLQYENQSS
jgi:uncharacterized damage-inducible protein DinB